VTGRRRIAAGQLELGGRVQDESLIEEMRAALRGDRERAEVRRRRPSPARDPIGHEPDDGATVETRPKLLERLGLRRRKS
jgi:hypothetical protein